jgi:hypothetical protein
MLSRQLYIDSLHLHVALEDCNTVVMFPKTPRPASTPNMYRPISFWLAVGKEAEAAILRFLKAFVERKPPRQSSIWLSSKDIRRLNNSFVKRNGRSAPSILRRQRVPSFVLSKKCLIEFGTRACFIKCA